MKTFKRILAIIALIFLIFGIKFYYEIAYSPYNTAISHSDRMTVFYRPGCSRCHKVLPKLLLPAYFSLKRDYFINANELTDKQLNKIGLTITPGFYSHGKLHETVNFDKIISLWEES